MSGGGKVAATLAVLAHAATAAIPVPAAPTGDDAEIIDLGREVTSLAAVTGSDGEVERAHAALTRIETRIIGLRATTFAALAVKLRIAADNLPEHEDRYGDDHALASALADVERMAGRA